MDCGIDMIAYKKASIEYCEAVYFITNFRDNGHCDSQT